MLLTLLFSLCVQAATLPTFNSSWGLKKEVYNGAVQALKNLKLKNENYASVVDFSQHSSSRRFYLFDLKKGTVERFNTSHGAGSDRNNDGYADSFSNTPSSHQSSLGAYLTAETYTGKHGLSLKLDGKDSTNSKARARAIVVHGATYVKNGGRTGRSHGCPALDMKSYRDIITKIKGGSLLYIGR